MQWKLVYAQYKAGRGLQAYAAADAKNKPFTQLADLFVGDKKWTDLETLVQAHRQLAPDDPDLYFQDSLLKIVAKQPAEAAVLLHKACAKQTVEYVRKRYVHRPEELADRGLALEGYRAVADKPAVFETLADRFVVQKKDKDLAALLEEHGQGREGDVVCEFYRGELHLLRGEAKQAEPHFAAAGPGQHSSNNACYRSPVPRWSGARCRCLSKP